MLLAALTFIVTMAFISNASNRIHPDEFDHVAAARFYFDNWLPPPVADPRTLDSYSYAGVSYLNEWDVVYLLAGKFALLTQPFVQSEVYALRCFNLFLFLVLTCLAWTRRDDILTFCILLLSPQIWYIFSYFNADAFPMFLALLAVYELTSPRTAFNDITRAATARYLRLGIYIGLIVLSKKTFWMFGLFAVCYTAIGELWCSGNRDWRLSLRRMGILTLIVCAVALPRIGYDLYVNGAPSQKQAKAIAAANQFADSGFKPSEIGGPYSEGIGLKNRGVGFVEMIVTRQGAFGWFVQSTVTAFGVYHYLSVRGPKLLYMLAVASVGLLIATLFISIIRRGNACDKLTLLLAVACSVGVVALSLYHSWVNDFQPQGRYLFAIFPILGLLLARSKDFLNPVYMKSIIAMCFLLSSCSFVLVGLWHIPKYWDQISTPTHPVLKLEREWKKQPD